MLSLLISLGQSSSLEFSRSYNRERLSPVVKDDADEEREEFRFLGQHTQRKVLRRKNECSD